jgi:Fe2+ transport system protein FeoA
LGDSAKNPERVAAGLKASIHNPQVSEEAKTKARERLHDMGAAEDSQNKHVAAGLKAAIHNPNVSAEAKQRDIERLHEMGIEIDEETSAKLGKHSVGEKEKDPHGMYLRIWFRPPR